MNSSSKAAVYGDLAAKGLWHNNPGLVQLLGLCPLLAVTTNVVNGFGLGLATLITLMTSNLLIASLRRFIRPEIRIPVFVLIIAATVTTVEMLMQAYFYDLYGVLGIFIPLIVTNCIIIGRAEAFASKQPVHYALVDGLMMGLGFLLVLMVLGGLRELVAHGTLFAQAELMFCDAVRHLSWQLSPDFKGLLLAALPPGAFIGLGLLVALKNKIDAQMAKKRSQKAQAQAQTASSQAELAARGEPI